MRHGIDVGCAAIVRAVADLVVSDSVLGDVSARLTALTFVGALSPYARRFTFEEAGDLTVVEALQQWQEIYMAAVAEGRDWLWLLRSDIALVGDEFTETDDALADGA